MALASLWCSCSLACALLPCLIFFLCFGALFQCTRCKADWCWLCGQDISPRDAGRDVDYHYNPTNLSGCPGSQFSQGNGEYLCLDRATSFVWWALFAAALVFAVMGYLGSLVAVFLGTGCCLGCCFCCFGARRCPDRVDSEVLQAVLVGPPLALALLAMTLLWVLVAVVSASCRRPCTFFQPLRAYCLLLSTFFYLSF